MKNVYGVTGNPFADIHNFRIAMEFGNEEEKKYWMEQKNYTDSLTRCIDNEMRKE